MPPSCCVCRNKLSYALSLCIIDVAVAADEEIQKAIDLQYTAGQYLAFSSDPFLKLFHIKNPL